MMEFVFRCVLAKPPSEWGLLTFGGRALGTELLRSCDHAGRIAIGERDPLEAVFRLVPSSRYERRWIKAGFEDLQSSNFLKIVPGFLVLQTPDVELTFRKKQSRKRNASEDHSTIALESLQDHSTIALESTDSHVSDALGSLQRSRDLSNPTESFNTTPGEKRREEKRREEKNTRAHAHARELTQETTDEPMDGADHAAQLFVSARTHARGFARGLGIIEPMDGADHVARIFGEERERAGKGGYQLRPGSWSTERDACQGTWEWAVKEAHRESSRAETVVRESIRGWLLDPWVKDKKPPPSITHLCRDPGKYRALYLESKAKADKELERVEAERRKHAPVQEATVMPADVERLIEGIGRKMG